MISFRLSILLFALALAACGDDEPTGTARDDDEGIPVTLADGLDDAVVQRDPFTLLEASIAGDTLRTQVGYSGGCRVHGFELLISTDFMESQPVQTTAILSHDADQDPCEAFVLTWLQADLTPLREVWEDFYGPGGGTIVLHLDVPVLEALCDTAGFNQLGRCSMIYDF